MRQATSECGARDIRMVNPQALAARGLGKRPRCTPITGSHRSGTTTITATLLRLSGAGR